MLVLGGGVEPLLQCHPEAGSSCIRSSEDPTCVPVSTLEATQGQILSQSPTDATSKGSIRIGVDSKNIHLPLGCLQSGPSNFDSTINSTERAAPIHPNVNSETFGVGDESQISNF